LTLFIFQWTDEIIEHLAEHGVTPEEFEAVVSFPDERKLSRRSGLPAAVGAVAGRRLFCVYRELTSIDIEPVTAYEIGP
jgi:hypothetical protein